MTEETLHCHFKLIFILNAACLVEDLGVLDDRGNSSCDQLMAGALTQSVNIGNGRSCINGTALGSVATYQCDRGYFLTVDDSRTCQCDGKWSEPVPKCIPSSKCKAVLVLIKYGCIDASYT